MQNLEKVGLLEEKEMYHLDDVIQVPEFDFFFVINMYQACS